MAEGPVPVRSHHDLVSLSGNHPFVRYALSSTLAGPAYAFGGAVAFVRTAPSGRLSLTALGAPEPLPYVVAAILADETVLRLGVQRISVPCGSRSHRAKR
jgi:hypothetical protein